jgi:hypothetical protein
MSLECEKVFQNSGILGAISTKLGAHITYNTKETVGIR